MKYYHQLFFCALNSKQKPVYLQLMKRVLNRDFRVADSKLNLENKIG